MRKVLTLFLFALLLLPVPAQAAAPVDLDTQGIVGGYSVDISAVGGTVSSSGTIADAPQVVEVYTATWCENCVPAEEALLESLEGEDVMILAMHRSIGEIEDPLGSDEGDQRWIDLYGAASKEAVGIERAPPTMVFDGARLKAGSTPEGDSLLADYEALFADVDTSKSRSDWTSSLSWTGNNSSGELTWDFTSSGADDLAWTHRLMVVEASAYFPEGSNDLEHYDHAVRTMYTLDVAQKTVALDLPAAWDGDDLSLVMVHEWQSVPHVDADPESDDGLLPGFLAPLGLIALGAAAVVRKD
jgi:hypothetical protein